MKTNSKKRIGWRLSALLLGLIVALEPAVGLGQEAQMPRDPWAKYELILERNMFSRQRGARRQQGDGGPRQEVAVPNPESYFRLKGIVQEDGRFIAFIEDTRSNSVLKLHAGDSVARGTIKTLTLDTIEYQLADQITTVQLGNDLEGGQGAVTMTELMQFSETSTGAPAAGSGEPAATPTGDAADILKQLMERRKAQLGQ